MIPALTLLLPVLASDTTGILAQKKHRIPAGMPDVKTRVFWHPGTPPGRGIFITFPVVPGAAAPSTTG